MADVTAINCQTAARVIRGDARTIGNDTYTGEPILRQRTFVLEGVFGRGDPKTIQKAIDDVTNEIGNNIAAKKPWLAAMLMVMLADLYANRGQAGDRALAFKTLGKLMVLCSSGAEQIKWMGIFGVKLGKDTTQAEGDAFDKALVENPDVFFRQQKAKALMGVAELVLKQLSDNEKTSADINKAIQYCEDARTNLQKDVPASELDEFGLGRAYILEAKLRALRSTETGDSDVAISGLLAKAKEAVHWDSDKTDVVWTSEVEKNLRSNRYICGDRSMYPNYDCDEALAEVKKSHQFIAAWANIESAKLVMQIVKVTKDKEPELSKKIEAAIALCKKARATLEGMGKACDYLNSEAAITEAELAAKHARLLPQGRIAELRKVRDYYESIAKTTPFNDIKARALAGQFSLEIEIGDFKWENVDQILKDYFDPEAGLNNLKYPFNTDTYPYMMILHLECQLRNVAKRTKVNLPGCESCTITSETLTSDYDIAAIRARYVRENIFNIRFIRDREALVDLYARSVLDEAQALATGAMRQSNIDAKIACFEAAIEKLKSALIKSIVVDPQTKKVSFILERPEDIEANPENRKMEVSFYVSVFADWASYLEQIAVLRSQGRAQKDPALYGDAKKKYEKVKALCAMSNSSYDKLQRTVFVDLALEKIKGIACIANEYTLTSADGIKTALTAYEKFIGKVDARITAAEDMPLTDDFKAESRSKLVANLKRIKFEAMCQRLFFVNKQKENLLLDAGIKEKDKDTAIGTMYHDAASLAKAILPLPSDKLPKLDDTYYTVLNLLGINSVYLRLNPQEAGESIKAAFDLYISKRDFEVTYDMVDALANGVIVTRDTAMKARAIKYLNEMISRAEGVKPQANDDIIILAKAYTWLARLNISSYVESDPSTASFLSREENGVKVGAIPYYEKALSYFDKVNGDRGKLLENGTSRVALMEEKALADFIYVNATLPGSTNDASRVARYREIADYIRTNVLAGATDVTGLKPEVSEKVVKQDKAAKIKARLTLISIVTSLAEPIQRSTVPAETVTAICGKKAADTKTLFDIAEEMFNGINTSLTTDFVPNDPDLVSFGIDPISIRIRMAENYMTLALKTSGTVSVMAVEAIPLREEVKEEGGSDAEGLLTEIDNYMAQLDKKRTAYASRSATYIAKMEAHLKAVTDAAGTSALNKARALLAKARFIGWMAGNFKEALPSMTLKKMQKALIDSLKESEDLYIEAERTYPGVMNTSARIDKAGILMVLTLAKAAVRTADVRAILGGFKEGSTQLTGIAAEEGLNGAKACAILANLVQFSAKENTTALDEARRYAQGALCKMLKLKMPKTAQEIINHITANKPVVDALMVQVLCLLGVIEARLYTLKPSKERIGKIDDKDNLGAAFKGMNALLDSISGIVSEPYKGMLPFDDGTLKIAMTEFQKYQDQIMLSYRDALKEVYTVNSDAYKTFTKSREYQEASTRPSAYPAKLEDLQKRLAKLR